MKKLFTLILFFALTSLSLMAQNPTDGDYRSIATGNWNDITKWQTRSGGNWAAASAPPNASNNVYIQTGHTITVNVTTAACKDLQVTTIGTATGILACVANIVEVNGKLRYSTTTGVFSALGLDGTFYSGQTANTSPANGTITCTTGEVKIVGVSRNITFVGEWGTTGLATSGRVEFALNSGETGTLATGFKCKDIIISNGCTIDMGNFRIAPDGTTAGSGTMTIKTNSKLIGSSTGAGNQVISRTGTGASGSLTLETGAFLELKGLTPCIDVNAFVNNGTIILSKVGTQTFLNKGSGGGTVVFNTYNNIIIDGGGIKSPFSATTVNGILTLTSGYVATTTTNLMTLGVTASTTGESAASFVAGPMAKMTNSTVPFVFPTGKGTDFRRISVFPTLSAPTTYKAEFFNVAGASRTAMTAPIQAVHSGEYFDLAAAPATPAIVGFDYVNPAGFCNATADLTIAHFSSGSWINEAATATGSAGLGQMVTTSAVTTYSPFAVGSLDAMNSPLPVRFKSFSAKNQGKTNIAIWETDLELNLNHFDIEKSIDGNNWSFLNQANPNEAKRYSIVDFAPFKTTYYRIKSIDNDNQSTYSNVISVTSNNSNVTIKTDDSKTLYVNLTDESTDNQVVNIFNTSGALMLQSKIEAGSKSFSADLSALKTGIYVVQIGTTVEKILVK